MDWGKFRDALDYGHHQLGISEELDNPQMRSEAYLNLARAHERLGKFFLTFGNFSTLLNQILFTRRLSRTLTHVRSTFSL